MFGNNCFMLDILVMIVYILKTWLSVCNNYILNKLYVLHTYSLQLNFMLLDYCVSLYTLCLKTILLTFDHNFGKCSPIFKNSFID